MKVYDVSRSISEAMTVYKDRDSKRISRRIEAIFAERMVNESSLCMNMHTGTHVDAPFHMLADGITMDAVDPALYFGPAKLFDLTNKAEIITAEDISKLDIQAGDIVIFKTRNSYSEKYDPKFVYIEVDAAEALVALGIKTVGIDAMSLERDKAEHPTHSLILGAGIGVIEDLRLAEVPAGRYFLMAVPLKLDGFEASPVRALLVDYDSE